MDKQFFSRENYIALKKIITQTSGINFNSKEQERELYENMINIYDNTDADSFHVLNKKCINIYNSRFQRQIPKNNEQLTNQNVIEPVQNVMQNNNKEYQNITPEFKDQDTNDLFSKIKKEREQSLVTESSHKPESSDLQTNFEENNFEENNTLEQLPMKPNNIIPRNTNLQEEMIQKDLEESFKNGFNLNEYHDNSDDDSDNEIIQNSIDRTDLNYELPNNIEDKIIPTSLNPYSLMNNDKELGLVEKDIFVIIDSKDRNLELYPNSNNFQVKFGGKPDSIEIPTHLEQDGTIINESATLYKGYDGANINMELKNIKYIQLVNVTVPYIPVYYNGNPPTEYSDENQTKPTLNDLLAGAYLPKFDPSKTGIPLDILEEPYLLIYIDEIDTQHYYRSTNNENDTAFSRVMNPNIISFQSKASFAVFTPQNENEKMIYEPTLLSSIDKMTLHIKDQSNAHINFGQDKIYVNEIKESSRNITNKCFSLNPESGTNIIITQEHFDYKRKECSNNEINHHELKPGDTIYFYDTRPCNNEHIYKLNKSQAKATFNYTNKTIEIKYKYKTTTKTNKTKTERTLSLSQYLFIGDFISINGMLFKINSFDGRKAKIEDSDIKRYSISSNITTNNIGFLRQNKRGFTSNNFCALNSKRGHKVVYIHENGGNSIEFTIDLPWSKIKANYDKGFYLKDTIFFIKKSLQTSFMFKFTVVEKRDTDLNSELV